MITVKKTGPTDIAIIQQLAGITWADAYGSIISPQQMEYMLDLFYSESSLQKQMQDGHQFILVYDDEQPVGFASYSSKKNNEPGLYRLHKIYILPTLQGRGVGKILLNYIVNDIKPAGAAQLELNVNRHNKAIGFYSKYGFTIIKEEDIDIGNGYFMNDYVMRLEL
jgi:ribosomal protein S18 acetylase RimI-like enzyme